MLTVNVRSWEDNSCTDSHCEETEWWRCIHSLHEPWRQRQS